MELKIVNWNIGTVAKENITGRLEFLWEECEPDIILTQESKSPKGFTTLPKKDYKYVIWNPKLNRSAKEGSAIISSDFVFEEINPEKFQGWLSFGVTEIPIGKVAFVSIHAPTFTGKNGKKDVKFFEVRKSCAYWIMDRALPFIEEKVQGIENVVIAGDTNCPFNGKSPYKDAHFTFSREYNYVEAIKVCNENCLIPTFRRSSKTKDWYIPNDHLFVRGPLAECLKSCKPIYEPDPKTQHAPILTSFEF